MERVVGRSEVGSSFLLNEIYVALRSMSFLRRCIILFGIVVCLLYSVASDAEVNNTASETQVLVKKTGSLEQDRLDAIIYSIKSNYKQSKIRSDSQDYLQLKSLLRLTDARKNRFMKFTAKKLGLSKREDRKQRFLLFAFSGFGSNKNYAKGKEQLLVESIRPMNVDIGRLLPNLTKGEVLTGKFTPSMVIFGADSMYIARTSCVDATESWVRMQQKLVSELAPAGNIIVLTGCGRIVWTDKKTLETTDLLTKLRHQ